jgi:putative intracellular protease/amidase
MHHTLKRLSVLLASVCATLASTSALDGQPAPPARGGHVLLVVSSAGRDSGRTRPGFEMDELSQAWLIFRGNGLAVTIASPAGGAVQADRFDPADAYNAAFLADTAGMRQLNDTRRTSGLRASDYDAVFVVGGKGAMFDLHADTALARLAGELYDRGAVVSAVCHGPAGLIRARTRDGRLLLAGRAVTGFSNAEESVFGKQWTAQFPFMLEDAMRTAGGRWEGASLMLPHVVTDGRLITGQNPFSTPATGEAVVRALGRTPVARTPWADERTVNFAAAALRTPAVTPRVELARMHKELKVELIGLLGYYQLKVAKDDAAVTQALTLMELAAPYMPQPEIQLGIAEAYHRTGRTEEARALVRSVTLLHPTLAAAKAMLAKLGG